MKRDVFVTLGFTVIFALASAAIGEQVLVIDDFEYADDVPVHKKWLTPPGAEPVLLHKVDGGTTALKIPYDFTGEGPDVITCDLQVPLDLSRYPSIQFDLYVDDPAVLKDIRISFRSGDGWYYRYAGYWVAALKYHPTTKLPKGWVRVVLDRDGFKKRGDPAGPDRIDVVRITAWKGMEAKTFCLIDNIQACIRDIAVIVDRRSKGKTASHEQKRIAEYVSTHFGLQIDRITSRQIESGALDGHKLAIFPHNPRMNPAQIGQIQRFVKEGGKLMVFGLVPGKVAALLGIDELGRRERDRKGQFVKARFEPDAAEVRSLPATLVQDPSDQFKKIAVPRKLAENAKVLARWQDSKDKLGEPAIVLADTGLFFGHRQYRLGDKTLTAFMRLMIERFVPNSLQRSADYALAKAVWVGPFTDVASLAGFLEARTMKNKPLWQKIQAHLATGRALKGQMDQAISDGRFQKVIDEARKITPHLVKAYMLCHEPLDGELRGLWVGAREGNKPAANIGTWTEVIKQMADFNFNALFPNLATAGVARYKSEILPTRDLNYGDHLAECVEAGKKYGVEIHVWKTNFFLIDTAEWFRKKMKKEDRLLKSVGGKEYHDRLCPSHPDNFALERDSMLEIVQKYDVDGIHFDYVRYKSDETCYCDGCRERFEKFRKKKVQNWPDDCYRGPLKDEYREWRVLQISRLVKAVAEESRKIKPHVKISAAVFTRYPRCRTELGQDWVQWIKEGWIDFLCPMNYRTEDLDYMRLVITQVGQVRSRVPLYSGIAKWQFEHNPDRIAGQIDLGRQHGEDGFILFALGRDIVRQTGPMLAETLMAKKAIIPHTGPVIEFGPPVKNDEPVVVCHKPVLEMQVTTVSLGSRRVPAHSITGQIEVQDLKGNTLQILGKLPPVGRTVPVSVKRLDGVFRVAAVGELTLQDGRRQRFIQRSRPYGFAQSEE